MKTKSFPKLITLLILIPLMTLTFSIQTESPFTSISESIQIEVKTSESHARQVYEPAHLASETCWETGKVFLICRYGGGICDVSDQGSCSSEDPVEN